MEVDEGWSSIRGSAVGGSAGTGEVGRSSRRTSRGPSSSLFLFLASLLCIRGIESWEEVVGSSLAVAVRRWPSFSFRRLLFSSSSCGGGGSLGASSMVCFFFFSFPWEEYGNAIGTSKERGGREGEREEEEEVSKEPERFGNTVANKWFDEGVRMAVGDVEIVSDLVMRTRRGEGVPTEVSAPLEELHEEEEHNERKRYLHGGGGGDGHKNPSEEHGTV